MKVRVRVCPANPDLFLVEAKRFFWWSRVDYSYSKESAIKIAKLIENPEIIYES